MDSSCSRSPKSFHIFLTTSTSSHLIPARNFGVCGGGVCVEGGAGVPENRSNLVYAMPELMCRHESCEAIHSRPAQRERKKTRTRTNSNQRAIRLRPLNGNSKKQEPEQTTTYRLTRRVQPKRCNSPRALRMHVFSPFTTASTAVNYLPTSKGTRLLNKA